jgi:hypothetical protein
MIITHIQSHSLDSFHWFCWPPPLSFLDSWEIPHFRFSNSFSRLQLSHCLISILFMVHFSIPSLFSRRTVEIARGETSIVGDHAASSESAVKAWRLIQINFLPNIRSILLTYISPAFIFLSLYSGSISLQELSSCHFYHCLRLLILYPFLLCISRQLNKPMTNGWYMVSLATLRSVPRPRLVYAF